jgi:hypothetical protein
MIATETYNFVNAPATPVECNDTFYPNTTTDPLTSTAFNESTALVGTTINVANGTFGLFYTDEHAMALGVSSVTINNGTPKTFPVSPSPSPGPAGSVSPPQVGGTYETPTQLGLQATATATFVNSTTINFTINQGGSGYSSATPPAVILAGGGGTFTSATATVNAAGQVTGITLVGATGYTSAPTVTIAPAVTPAQLAAAQPQGNTDVSGRPLFPSLYITDITGATQATIDNLQFHVGDWQYGGTPVAPNTVFGTWKSFTESIDTTTGTVKLTAANDPSPNGTNLGPGADPLPSGFTGLGYTAEAQWNLAQLQKMGLLIPGHEYRFYMIVHDGD